MTTEEPQPPTITLTPDELEHLTGYRQPTQQLNVLRSRGFHRAFISRGGLPGWDRTSDNRLRRPIAKTSIGAGLRLI